MSESKEKLELIDVISMLPYTWTYIWKRAQKERTSIILLKEDRKPLELSDLEAYIERLNNKRPNKKFILEEVEVNEKKLLRVRKIYDDFQVPEIRLYFDLENQRVYIEKEQWEKERKLCLFVIVKVLGALGITTVKHVPSRLRKLRRELEDRLSRWW